MRPFPAMCVHVQKRYGARMGGKGRGSGQTSRKKRAGEREEIHKKE